MSSKRHLAHGHTSIARMAENEKVKQNVDRGQNSEILIYYLEASYHGPAVRMKLGRHY